jgi:uncharacterized protein (DUF2235 family)
VKHILYCADGTWNGPGETPNNDIDRATNTTDEGNARKTNVWKLFLNLAGAVTPEAADSREEQEKVLRAPSVPTGTPVQIAKYMHGVGDSSNLAIKVVGGATGAGVIARIVRGYTFISRNYQPGDAIHIVGFSRGAYTARALAGMICAVGLLNPARYDPSNKIDAYIRGHGAWLKARGIVIGGGGEIAHWFTGLVHSLESVASRFLFKSGDFITDVPIRSVAVWDTVGALGVPLYVDEVRRDAFSFVDTKLNPKVQKGFHAMALDERRRDFPVTRWVARDGVREVWFSGCHSDVGGGYPEAGLSDLALSWMMDRLGGEGVAFAKPFVITPDLTRYAQDIHKPWESPPFNIDPQARVPLANDNFDDFVRRRWAECAPYRNGWPKDGMVAKLMSAPAPGGPRPA